MKKFIINSHGTIHFDVEVEANSLEEAKQRVSEMDTNNLNLTEIFIEESDLEENN